MFFLDINDRDFIELLGALPSSPAVTRAHILGAFGVHVTGDDPVAWWRALTLDRGKQGAANAVAQLVIDQGGKRALALIEAEAAGRSIEPRADDPKLVRLLFDESMEEFVYDQFGLQHGVCEYFKETQAVGENGDRDPPEPGAGSEPVGWAGDEHHSPSSLDPSSATPMASSQRGARWTLKRVQSPSRGFLTVPVEWREKDLEAFLWDNWESIDFGFDRPIHRAGKQQRLSEDTNDRVDLLAEGTSGERFAIELKITAARRGDYTQLTSYLGNLESSGVPADKVRGILVAPAFSQKVLNSAAIEPRITLLQFNRKP